MTLRRVIGWSGLLASFLVVICASAASAATTHPYTGTSFGPAGPAGGEDFQDLRALAFDAASGSVYAYDAGASRLYKFDAEGNPSDFSATGTNYIEGVAGAVEAGAVFEVAVAPAGSLGGTAGDIYVATNLSSEGVRIYAPSGAPLGAFGNGETCGVATDPEGRVFVATYAHTLTRYTPTADPVKERDISGVNGEGYELQNSQCNVAIDGGETVYSANYLGGISKIAGLTGETSTLLDPTANTLVVDPTGGAVYADRGNSFAQYDPSGNLVNISGQGQLSSSIGIAADGATEFVYAADGATERVDIFGAPVPVLPSIEEEQAASVESTEAEVTAEVNPQGSPTSVFVEYGETPAYGQTTAAQSVGADEVPHLVRATLTGLKENALVHYRFVAESAVGTTQGNDKSLLTTRAAVAAVDGCPNSTFRTGPAARLADCRAYEMVTPVDKNGLDISTLLNLGNNPVQLDQSATSGERLTYTTLQSFGDTQGAPYVSQYLATRASDGWSNGSITPPEGTNYLNPGKRLELEFQLFSSDLCVSLLNHYADPPLAPLASEGIPNTYRRANCGQPQYETVSTVSLGGEEAPEVQGLSADGQCGLFAPIGPVLGGLYETCKGQTRQINVLPDGTASVKASAGTSSASAGGEYSLRGGNYQGSVSADGSRVYWSPAQASEGAPLYLRENAAQPQSALGLGNECLEASKACTIPVSSESAQAFFWGASPTGARAIYTVEEGLAKQKLYEFNIATGISTPLAGRLDGVMGVDEQANRVYFVSEESISGQGTDGRPNLYLYDATKAGAGRYRFVATVSSADALFGAGEGKRLGMVQRGPYHRVARLSPDGLHAVFSAYAPLTGYDNTDAVSGEADLEVFAYDTLGGGGAGSLTCVSCNPSGRRPHGIDVEVESEPSSNPNWAAALIPPYATSFYGSRAVSEEGQRIFFDSYDALLPADTNGKEDVYEWEASGSGPASARCTEASASYSSPNGGCLTLISLGESGSASEFVDASPDGRDVFFKTASSLVPQDPGQVDIYDAREDGGFPPPAGQPSVCEGAACQGPGQPPQATTPSSSSFSGPGNVKPHKKKHHKKKQHHKKKHQKRADRHKEAGR